MEYDSRGSEDISAVHVATMRSSVLTKYSLPSHRTAPAGERLTLWLLKVSRYEMNEIFSLILGSFLTVPLSFSFVDKSRILSLPSSRRPRLLLIHCNTISSRHLWKLKRNACELYSSSSSSSYYSQPSPGVFRVFAEVPEHPLPLSAFRDSNKVALMAQKQTPSHSAFIMGYVRTRRRTPKVASTG